MSTITATTIAAITNPAHSSFLHDLMDEWEHILCQHRAENPDLYRIIQLKKKKTTTTGPSEVISKNNNTHHNINAGVTEPKTNLLWDKALRGAKLRARIQKSHREIRQHRVTLNADIIPRTQAYNRKCAHHSLEEEREFRADVVAAQIRSWRSILPNLIRKFASIPDYRRVTSIKHTITVLMVFGLFAFIFRLSSRREMNRELTSPVIFEHLRKLFPEIDTIPHADTLARVLAHINPKTIEAIHINLINLNLAVATNSTAH